MEIDHAAKFLRDNERTVVLKGPWEMFDRVDWSDTPDASDWAWICGLGRSGTTLMSKMMSASPDVYIGNETQVIPSIIGMLLSEYYYEPNDGTICYTFCNNDGWTGAGIRAFADAWRKARCGSAKIVGDKAVVYWSKRWMWRQIFPNSSFIYTFRHPLDNVVSLLNMPGGWTTVKYDHTDESALRIWENVVKTLITQLELAISENMLLFNYDLMDDPDAAVDGVHTIFERLGIDPPPAAAITEFVRPKISDWREGGDVLEIIRKANDPETMSLLENWDEYVARVLG